MAQTSRHMRAVSVTNDLLNSAFGLAYFILGDRPASIYVAMAAMDKLKAASAHQGRRLYYTPIGRSAHPATRNKVNLSDLQLLQRLVYIESDLFERLLEGQQQSLREEDLIIRYIKHLVRITTKHNSFYVTLGLCRLLYNYTTAETAEIYNLVLQDPVRMRDDHYYRSRKKRLMEEMKDRFGDLIRVEQGFRRAERFQSDKASAVFAGLVRECLERFTPWQSTCVLPKDLDPKGNVVAPLLFEGGDPDEEHEIELNRIHSLIHPGCFARLTAALDLDPAEHRLELPSFFTSSGGPRNTDDRFHPTELTEGELDAIKHYLDKNAVHRKQFSQAHLRLLIDGKTHSDFQLQPSRRIKFDLDQGPELIEIRSSGPIEADGDTALAVCVLEYDRSGVVPVRSVLNLGQGHQLSIAISPPSDPAASGAILEVDCQQRAPSLAILGSIRRLDFRDTWKQIWPSGDAVPGLALALLFIAVTLGGVWVYFHSGRAHQPEVAALQPDNRDEKARVVEPSAVVPPAQREAATPSSQIRERQPNAGNQGARSTAEATNEAKEVPRLRGTEARAVPAVLLAVKKVYVDSLGDDSFSGKLREELIARLKTGNRFEVVANRDNADAVFRGSARPGQTPGSNSSVDLELINAAGQTVWSISSRASMPAEASEASAKIVEKLLRDKRRLEQQQ